MLGNLLSAKMSSAEFLKLAFSSIFFLKTTIRIANSLDPDETPRSVASHLDPNCLQRPSKSGSSAQRVKVKISLSSPHEANKGQLFLSKLDVKKIFLEEKNTEMESVVPAIQANLVKTLYAHALTTRWFPDDNSRTLRPRIMKLHRYIDHDWQMTPIDFEVTRSKVKVTVTRNSQAQERLRLGS